MQLMKKVLILAIVCSMLTSLGGCAKRETKSLESQCVSSESQNNSYLRDRETETKKIDKEEQIAREAEAKRQAQEEVEKRNQAQRQAQQESEKRNQAQRHAQQESEKRNQAQRHAQQKKAEVSNENKNKSATVYIAPTGKRWHYLAKCAGKNATATTIAKAESLNLTPCKKCAK